MKNKFSRSVALALVVLGLAPFSSCINELNQEPSYEPTVESVYRDPARVKEVLARLYATMAVSGQQGPAGQPDIAGIDEGFSNYLRQYWMAQELTTDEAVLAWESDAGVPEYNRLSWSPSHPFVRAMYDRIFYQISLCNEFIRQTSDAKLSEYGISAAEQTNIKQYRAEARFLRAMSYYHALDMFGNVPFADETSAVGTDKPRRIERPELFAYVETELKAALPDLAPARTNEFGRADQAAAWMVLAKLYQNAPVYLSTTPGGTNGTDRSTDVITYANKVIEAGYQLSGNYANLFRSDNSSVARSEIIFPVRFDGVRTKTYGGMTFIIHASVGGKMSVDAFGIDNGWGGTRTKKNLVNLFPESQTDKRAMFFSDGQSLEIKNVATFTDGYAVTKFKNVTSQGVAGNDKVFPDTDFPMFRLADAYLMYVEAVVRGGTGGNTAQAVTYFNLLRQRAYGNASGNITAADLAGQNGLDLVLNERGRELYWEGHRRTDLIRFGKYARGYNWPFKGGVQAGTDVELTRTLYPLPTSDLTANPNLKQNPGY